MEQQQVYPLPIPYSCIGAFYYMLGNVHPQKRSKISSIQLLLLVKYTAVAEFGMDRMLEPIVNDLQKLESVSDFYYAIGSSSMHTIR